MNRFFVEAYGAYEHVTPKSIKRVARGLISSPESLRLVVLYIIIGGAATAMDLCSFVGLMAIRTQLSLAVSVAFLLGTSAHFSLNRVVNFKAFDRSVSQQLSTYAVVLSAVWLTTILFVNALVSAGISPIVSFTLSFP